MPLHQKIIIGIIIVVILSVAGYLSYQYYFKEILEGKKEQAGDEVKIQAELSAKEMERRKVYQELAALSDKEISAEERIKVLNELSNIKSSDKKITNEERKRVFEALNNLK